MLGRGGSERSWELSAKFRILGAAPVPEREAVRQVIERKYFFDAAVAVGGYHEHFATEIGTGALDSDHHVVMKLALLPVVDELVATPALPYLFEQAAEH